MALEEKAAEHELIPVNLINGEHKQPAHVARNPFGTVPAFAHDGLEIYETSPILRYVDQVFPGVSLTPDDPRQRARMNQVISIIDYHGYSSMIGQIAVHRLFSVLLVNGPDEEVVKAGTPRAALCLKEIDRIKGDDPFLAGSQLSLADLYVVPILFYLRMTPERELMTPYRGLETWMQRMTERPSFKRTAPNLG
jgi:glutathione S-transferase